MYSELPQVVEGLPASEYFAANDFVSRSFLVAVLRGGGEAQKWIDDGHSLFDGNASTKLGNRFDALVSAVWSGKTFSDVVAVAPPDVLAANGARRGGKFDAWKEEVAAQGKIDCSADEAFQLEKMLEHMLENDAARELLEATVSMQRTVFFELLGHRCKTRPDGCTLARWWDLKSTSATWDKIYNSAVEYGYAAQEWLYVQSAIACGMEPFRMPFVFVQTMPPYRCKVFHLPVEMVEQAGRDMQRVMEQILLRRETGIYFSADAHEITEIAVPAWAKLTTEEYA